MLDLAREEALLEMLRGELKSDQEKFAWRGNQLLQTAVLALAQGEQQMDLRADLIVEKLRPN